MSDILPVGIFIRLANQCHQVNSRSDLVLQDRESRIFNTFHITCIHTRLWEIPPSVLLHEKVPVVNTNSHETWRSVSIVSLHIVHIGTYVETLHVIQDGLPLLSHVDVS